MDLKFLSSLELPNFVSTIDNHGRNWFRKMADEGRSLILRGEDYEPNLFPDDPEYQSIITRVEKAIERQVYPERIKQGSSGSYFSKTLDGVSILLYFISYHT